MAEYEFRVMQKSLRKPPKSCNKVHDGYIHILFKRVPLYEVFKYFPGMESTHDIMPRLNKFFKFYFVNYSTYLKTNKCHLTIALLQSAIFVNCKVQFTKIPHEEESLLRQNWLKGQQYILGVVHKSLLNLALTWLHNTDKMNPVK